MKKLYTPMILALLAALLVQPASSQKTVRMNLERMVASAGTIVHGTVTSVTTGADTDTRILCTTVTIAVAENFYGADQPTVTLKMVGGKAGKKTVRFAEMPRFTVGEEVYVLVHQPSPYGFTSPVGMGQGKFTVQRDAAAKIATVRNGAGNRHLFSGMKNVALRSLTVTGDAPEMSATELSSVLRSLVTSVKK